MFYSRKFCGIWNFLIIMDTFQDINFVDSLLFFFWIRETANLFKGRQWNKVVKVEKQKV
jgi:hypothetical protein